MLPDSERDELRVLQRKAYAPGGAVTAAEAERLRALEDAQRRSIRQGREAAAPSVDGEAAGEDAGEPLITRVPQTPPVSVPTVAPSSDAVAADESPDVRRPRPLVARPLVAVLAAAALVGIGFGAGWALFADRSAEPPLSAAEEERRAELAADGGFDASSLRPIARDDDALAWFATQDGGERVCLILDVGAASSQECEDRDAESGRGPWTSVLVQADDVDPGAGAGAEATVSVNALMLFATDGEPLVAIQRWSQSAAMATQFPAEDRERASELIDQGFTAELSLIGSFGERPVWLGTRFDAQGAAERCLVVDAADGRAQCRTDFERNSLVAQVRLPQDPSAELWTLEARNTPAGVPFLTITAGAAPGDESVEVGGQHGDPIEVRFPSDSSG